MIHKRYDFRTAYIDLLLNVLTTILFITAIAFSLIALKKANEDVGLKTNAQYVFTAEWDRNLDCDVDIWAKDPQGNKVFFKNKESGIMHIDRDDMGMTNDTVYNANGERLTGSSENKEIWTLRGKQYGEFIFNVHLYSCKSDNAADPYDVGDIANVKVTVELLKINPVITSMVKREVLLEKIWEEKTAVIADIGENGATTKVDEERQLLEIERGVN